MSFSFSAFPGQKGPNIAAELAASFTECWRALAEELADELDNRQDVHFLVIDITPGREEPRDLADQLRDLLLETAGKRPIERLGVKSDNGRITRLLFVGANASLDTWETESVVRYSRLKALELYVRALQSGHLAHYVNVIKPSEAKHLPEATFSEVWCPKLARSELLTMDTYFQETKRALIAPKNDPRSARLRERAKSRLAPFEEGLVKLRGSIGEFLKDVRRNSSGFDAPKEVKGVGQDKQILFDLRAVFQLGKRTTDRAYECLAESSLMRPECNFEDVPAGGAYQLRHQLEQGLDVLLAQRSLGDPNLVTAERLDEATAPLDASLRLRRYELLRDVSRCISIGAINYLKREHQALHGGTRKTARPKGMLIIDAQLCEEVIRAGKDTAPSGAPRTLPSRLRTRLLAMTNLIGWTNACWVARADQVIPGLARRRVTPDEPSQNDEPIDPHDKAAVFSLETGTEEAMRLEDFSIILIEIDSSGQYVGPAAVQLLARHLETLARERGEGPAAAAPVIVFTQTESFGHIQQSLNLGAVAYVLKERIYQLPFQMRRALEGVITYRPSTDSASSFRSLQALRPEIIGKLKRHDRNYLVRGRKYEPSPRQETKSGVFIERPPHIEFDEKELAWIRELPKADLHCHFGTCIPFAAYEVMALNTSGYALSRPEDRGDHHNQEATQPRSTVLQKLSFENEGVRDTILRLALAVVLSEHLTQQAKGRLHPLVCLAIGAQVATEGRLHSIAPFGLGDKIVESFRDESAKLQGFEVASLLVALLSREETSWSKEDRGLPSPRNFLKRVAEAVAEDFTAHGRGAFQAPEGLSSPVLDAAAQLTEKMARIARGWSGPDTLRYFKDLTNGRDPKSYWQKTSDSFEERVTRAETLLTAVREEARAWLAGSEEIPSIPGWKTTRTALIDRLKGSIKELDVIDHVAIPQGLDSASAKDVLSWLHVDGAGAGKIAPSLTLEDYVILPDRHARYSASLDKGLQRYLWGADFLGAEHLQYPENLLIGAYAFTGDNACDNVTYSEVRCETPGYCRGGMSSRDATDLLCLGLDFSAAFLNTLRISPALPLVRTSVLLAAKRHKDDTAAREVVSLLEAYLNQQSDLVGIYVDTAPSWWRPTSVVGFDISGNEAKNPDWMQTTLEPLKRLSSPITIHAGEAADAKSVWNAVYLHHARRIGHGLRLREDRRLLDYCVSEGICMEMCPNSNVFTNAFHPIGWPELYPLEETNAKSAYPLLAYMRRGLEVTVATDNRYIHNPGFRTLSSEYLTAARLSGGLTRWEVLQLIKAGFKNAFLAKRDVAVLVKEMEDRVYRTVSRGWF